MTLSFKSEAGEAPYKKSERKWNFNNYLAFSPRESSLSIRDPDSGDR